MGVEPLKKGSRKCSAGEPVLASDAGMGRASSDGAVSSRAAETYRQLLMHAAVGLAGIDAQGRFHFVNPAFCRLTGLSESDLIGRKAPLSHWPPEVFAKLEEAFRSKADQAVDLVIQSPGRGPTPVSLQVSPIGSGPNHLGWVTVNIDITERHRAREQGRQREALFAAAVQMASLGIWTVDAASDSVTWNGRFHLLLGYPVPSLADAQAGSGSGLPPDPESARYRYSRAAGTARFLARVHPDDRPRVREAVKHRFAGRTLEVRLQMPDGSQRIVALREAVALDANGRFATASGICYDLTEERRQTMALAHDQKMEALNRLSGALAHDLNNVLGIVIGSLREIDAALEEDARSRVAWGTALEAAVRGAELVSSLLAFARQPSGLAPGRPAPVFRIDTHLTNVLPMIRFVLGPAIVLQSDVLRVPVVAHVDPTQFASALLNLVTNARDAMNGEGTLSLSLFAARMIRGQEAVRLALAAGPYVRLQLEDDGEGMSEHVLARAPEPYFTTKPVGSGSGLGLAQVDQMARASGGRLQIESVPGKGTRVMIYLPAAPVDVAEAGATQTATLTLAQSSAQTPTPTPTPTSMAMVPLRVLVVDDEPQLGRLVQRVLERRGHRVEVCDTVREARSALKGGTFDMLLADIVMPGTMNGPALVVWSMRRFANLRCGLMTGYSPDPAREPAGVPVLRKPFFPDDLVSFVERVGGAGPCSATSGTEAGPTRP